jgi:hypothetical protein
VGAEGQAVARLAEGPQVAAEGVSRHRAGQVTAPPRWVGCRPGFFLPVRVLSRAFRAEYVAGLRSASASGQLVGLPTGPAQAAWWASLYAQEWVVSSQPPFAGPDVVLKYLARYTQRVALSNRRLVSCARAQTVIGNSLDSQWGGAEATVLECARSNPAGLESARAREAPSSALAV